MKITTLAKKSLPVGGALVLALTISPSTLAASLADFIFVVDESGSMAGEHSWLGSMITDLDSALTAKGVAGRYGLVGFGGGGSGNLGRQILVGGGDFGTAAQFATATSSLVTSGGFEDGYSGMNFAFSNYSFDPNAAVNIVLVTDEDRDNGNSSLTYSSILSQFAGKKALLNAVVNHGFVSSGSPALGIDSKGNAFVEDGFGGFTKSTGGAATSGFGTTKADYIDLALATGGAAWDLNKLRAGGLTATSFTKSFVDIKVKEVIEQPGGDGTKVPEPASLFGLLGFGALGAISTLKRKKAAN